MKLFYIIALALLLSGCALGKSIFQGGSSLTATVPNPVGLTVDYDIEAGVAAVRRVGLEAIRTRQCHRTEAPSVTNICVPRYVKVDIQNADARLIKVLKPFRAFVRDNPNVSAVSVAGDVYKAIKDYQNTLYINGVTGAQ